MFFNRKKQENQKEKKQEFAALFFPLALLLLLLLKKKLDERSKMKEKKIQIIHYLKFERIFVRPEKKRKQKPLRSVCTIEKENIRKKQSVGDGWAWHWVLLVATPSPFP